MRSSRATAVSLGVVALLCLVLLAFTSGAEGGEKPSWSGRALLALAPLRPEKKGKHRHGRVEFRYQNVDCEDGPTTVPTTTVPTTTTTAPTTTTEPTTTVLTTVPETTTTTTTTTTSTSTTIPVTTRPCEVECPPANATNDPCRPWTCVRDDQQDSCRQVEIICNDGNPCTVDTCVDGECRYVLAPEKPGCNCTTKDCMSNGCTPMECEETATGPICVLAAGGRDCNDFDNCTIDACVFDPEDPFVTNCTFTFNSSIPGCAAIAPGGLDGGQIAGIVIGAVAAAAAAALIAAWARRRNGAAAGTTNAATSPLAQTSPLYAEPGTAGEMPAL